MRKEETTLRIITSDSEKIVLENEGRAGKKVRGKEERENRLKRRGNKEKRDTAFYESTLHRTKWQRNGA